jgi:hypothetical protein
MIQKWDEEIESFIIFCKQENVRMLMVGGGAVNFHGYQRHSADVDFWIETTEENFSKLVTVFRKMGYDIDDFPEAVKQQEQNISVKFSPESLILELITNFSVNRPFEKAFAESRDASSTLNPLFTWKVLSIDDLIISKIKAGRAKDLLDIQQLKQINKI